MSPSENAPIVNRLPVDGAVNYYGRIFTDAEASVHFDTLMGQIAWKHDEAVIFGKRIATARKVAWYGDSTFAYTYSGITKQASPWTEELRVLKTVVEGLTKATYNSCLLNLYHNGNEGVAWHSDGEKCLVEDAPIASLSFGAERAFRFKHKHTGEIVSVLLEHSGLLVMKGTTQKHWLHCLPKTKRITTPRINLTFRSMHQR